MITPEMLAAHAQWLADFNTGNQLVLADANLTGAKLTGANLTGADLTRADLTADLTGANLTGASLTRANLTWANLTGASLTRANLTWANLTGAYLTADLTRADLTGVKLTGVKLTGAIGNMREIKSAHFDRYAVTWTADVLAIGCQQHPIEWWRAAYPEWIDDMAHDATDWWSQYGALVLSLIDASPATGKVLEEEASK
jgi:hypothetical protein